MSWEETHRRTDILREVTATAEFRHDGELPWRDEWAELFAPLDACVAPVLTLQEAPHHPHNVERASYVQVGNATVAGPAPRFSATPGATRELTAVGADSAALLAEAGYSEQELNELRETGAIR